jgi:nucleoside-diphosphate-sugar epimerase
LVEVLHGLGHKVTGLERHEGNTLVGSDVPMPDVTYIGDIRDREIVLKAAAKTDAIINLAGILGTQETVDNPYPSVEVNIFGALNTLEAARAYKLPYVQIAVGNHWMNNSYSITKTTAERFTLMYANEHGIKANVVRALNAFGERQSWYPVRKMMPFFITQALKDKDIEVYGDGSQVMDFVYVKDVGKILLEALTNDRSGEVYEAGTGKHVTVKQWAEKIIKLSGSKSKVVNLPMRPGEPPHSVVVAKDPYPIEYSNVDEKLAQTIAWYKKNA